MSQIPKYTFSRISRQQQANSGIGWSDEGIAKYNEVYDLVDSDCQLQDATLSGVVEGSLETPSESKKTTEWNVDNKRAKSKSLATIYEGARSLSVDPP